MLLLELSDFISNSYKVMVDKTVAIEVEKPDEAIACMFASYYIFNVEYSKEVRMTLEFIQK